MTYAFRPVTEADVATLVSWRYPGRYATYDVLGTESFGEHHVALEEPGAEVVGYCCFGAEARVPGLEAEPGTVDVGWGLRPDLLGEGRGREFVAAILDLARGLYAPDRFRIAVLDWNERSRRVAESVGFRARGRTIDAPASGGRFVVLERPAGD